MMTTDGRAARTGGECVEDANPGVDSMATKSDAQNRSRSQRNISEWNSYLPPDCVACMIAMGWDLTT